MYSGHMESINASEFKAKCLAARPGARYPRIDHDPEAWPAGGSVHSTPIAGAGYPQDELRCSVEVLGDIVSPVLPAATWEAESDRP